MIRVDAMDVCGRRGLATSVVVAAECGELLGLHEVVDRGVIPDAATRSTALLLAEASSSGSNMVEGRATRPLASVVVDVAVGNILRRGSYSISLDIEWEKVMT